MNRFLGSPLASIFGLLVTTLCQRSTRAAAALSTVKNIRPVVAGSIFRAASLDSLSESDARSLLDGSALGGSGPLAAVVDLRNSDEIRKGGKERSDGAKLFYSSLGDSDGFGDGAGGAYAGRLINVPVLGDVDGFWDEAINRMDAQSRAAATLQTVFSGGALDRAAARNLEDGGHSMLYTVMLATAQRPLCAALEACARESARGPVIFHCQKGKDRTGILSMLIQACLGDSDKDIIEAYSLSGELLGGEDAISPTGEASRNQAKQGGSSSGTVDWSYFRGSPPSAMADTLGWICQRYGSVNGYLDAISFDKEKRKRLGKTLVTMDALKSN